MVRLFRSDGCRVQAAPVGCGCGCEGRTRRVVPVSSTDGVDENENEVAGLDTFPKSVLSDVRMSAKPKLA
jgi:hypothetical protein